MADNDELAGTSPDPIDPAQESPATASGGRGLGTGAKAGLIALAAAALVAASGIGGYAIGAAKAPATQTGTLAENAPGDGLPGPQAGPDGDGDGHGGRHHDRGRDRMGPDGEQFDGPGQWDGEQFDGPDQWDGEQPAAPSPSQSAPQG